MQGKSNGTEAASLLVLRGASGAGKSSVGQALARLRPAIQIIEVDDLKRAKYGRASICVPSVDYPEAGAAARKFLEQGIDTVVIEPLWDRWHLRSVISGAGRLAKSRDVVIVWLECSVATAVERKRGRIEPSVVEHHHQHVISRDRPRNEVVIDSERHSAEEIAAMLLDLLPQRVNDKKSLQPSSR